tara:strand:+ start:63652 stop:64041 length:390 start_codon:yes stop_codon:yes gene_type:complete
MKHARQSTRFWILVHNSPVRLTLWPGRALQWGDSWQHKEGWSSEYEQWKIDTDEPTTIVNEGMTDGRDCDGRLQQFWARHCATDRATLTARTWCNLPDPWNKTGDDIPLPQWKSGESSQRDYSAEAMNY